MSLYKNCPCVANLSNLMNISFFINGYLCMNDSMINTLNSMTNTPEYKLAKFLDNIKQPHIPHKYMLK